MATLLDIALPAGFSMFLAAILSTILILLVFEKKMVLQNKALRWTAISAVLLIVIYSIASRPSVVPLTAAVLVLFLMPFALSLLIIMMMNGRWVFYHSTQGILSISIVIIAVLAICYAIGDKILSVNTKDIVLGVGSSTFHPFGAPVLGMALLLTLGALLTYSAVKFRL